MSLRKKAYSATRWVTGSAALRGFLQILQTIILARILTPSDFGLMALAGVSFSIAALFSDLGISKALMYFPYPDKKTFSTLYWLNILIAISLGALFTLSAKPISLIYDRVELIPLLSLLSLNFLFSAIGQPFRVLAEKQLHFRKLAQNEVIATFLGFISAILLADLGFGVMSIVSSILLSSLLNSFLSWYRLSQGLNILPTFSFALVKPHLKFGLHRVGDGIWNKIRIHSDIMIAGLYSAPSAIAFYALPKEQTLKISNTIINPTITRLGLPVMSQLKDNPEKLRVVYLKTLSFTSSVNFPIYALLALFSDNFVSLLLGNQWQGAGFYMMVFAIFGLIRSTGNPSGSLLYAVGMAKRSHIWNMVLCLITVPMLWASMKLGGLKSLALTILIWQTIVFFLAWRFLIFPASGIHFFNYIASITPSLTATLLSTCICIILVNLLPSSLSNDTILLFGILSFSTFYLVLSWIINKEWIKIIIDLVSVHSS